MSEDQAGGGPALVVYWRPGCGFCSRLLRTFDRYGVVAERRNIWEDPEARDFVRRHNDGNETVPTVALGDEVDTNPSPKAYVEDLAGRRPDLVATPEPARRWFGR